MVIIIVTGRRTIGTSRYLLKYCIKVFIAGTNLVLSSANVLVLATLFINKYLITFIRD